ENREMHEYIIEGLDRVFADRGLPAVGGYFEFHRYWTSDITLACRCFDYLSIFHDFRATGFQDDRPSSRGVPSPSTAIRYSPSSSETNSGYRQAMLPGVLRGSSPSNAGRLPSGFRLPKRRSIGF